MPAPGSKAKRKNRKSKIENRKWLHEHSAGFILFRNSPAGPLLPPPRLRQALGLPQGPSQKTRIRLAGRRPRTRRRNRHPPARPRRPLPEKHALLLPLQKERPHRQNRHLLPRPDQIRRRQTSPTNTRATPGSPTKKPSPVSPTRPPKTSSPPPTTPSPFSRPARRAASTSARVMAGAPHGNAGASASEGVPEQRGASPRRAYVLRPVTERNCVAARRG